MVTGLQPTGLEFMHAFSICTTALEKIDHHHTVRLTITLHPPHAGTNRVMCWLIACTHHCHTMQPLYNVDTTTTIATDTTCVHRHNMCPPPHHTATILYHHHHHHHSTSAMHAFSICATALSKKNDHQCKLLCAWPSTSTL